MSFLKYCFVKVFEPEYAFEKNLNKLLLDYQKEEDSLFLSTMNNKSNKGNDDSLYNSYISNLENLQNLEAKYEREYKKLYNSGSISNINYTSEGIAYFCIFDPINKKEYSKSVFIKKRLPWLLCFKDEDLHRHLEFLDGKTKIDQDKCKMLFKTSTKEAIQNLDDWLNKPNIYKSLGIKEKQIHKIENYLKNFHKHSELVFDYGDFLINIGDSFLENSNEVKDLFSKLSN